MTQLREGNTLEPKQKESSEEKETSSPITQKSTKTDYTGCLGCLLPILFFLFIIFFPWTHFDKEKDETSSKKVEPKTYQVHKKTVHKEAKKPEPTETATPTPTVQVQPSPLPLPSFGDKVQVGNLIYQINGMRTAKTVGHSLGLDETAKGLYYIVSFTVDSDKWGQGDMVDYNLFKLEMGNQEFLPDLDATSSIENEDLSNPKYNYPGIIAPLYGVAMSGEVAFDLPPNASNLELKVIGSISDWDDNYKKSALIRVYVNS